MKFAPLVTLICALIVATSSAPLHAKSTLAPTKLRTIGIDQRIGEQVPMDLAFRDEHGQNVSLASRFGKRPVVLALIYNRCPMLCNQVLAGLGSSLRVLTLDAGDAFDVLAVSIDPEEKPAAAARARGKFLERYQRAGSDDGVHFLTGDQHAITALTDAVGFRYEYDEAQGEYAHASAIMVLTPEGKVARYFFGTEYSPRDLRLAVVEASEGKVGSVTDHLLLLCYRYDPAAGTYSAHAINAIRVGGAVTVLLLGGFVVLSLRRDRRRKRAQQRNGTVADGPTVLDARAGAP